MKIGHKKHLYFVSQSESSTKEPFNIVSQSESSITSSESSANQNRVLRHSRALGYGGGPSSALGLSRIAIDYHNTSGFPHTPSGLVTVLLLANLLVNMRRSGATNFSVNRCATIIDRNDNK